MKEREALKLALEAAYLAGFNASGEGYNGEYPFGDKMQDPAENRVWKKNRDNYIKEALAQPEKFQPDRITTLRQLTENHSVDCLCADCVELDDIEEALAQPEHDPYDEVFIAYGFPKPEQEPVAWLDPNQTVDTHALSWYQNKIHSVPLYISQQHQENPVAEISQVNGCPIVLWDKSLPIGTKLYTAPQQSKTEQEPTRSQKMRDAGITRRPKGWDKESDEPEQTFGWLYSLIVENQVVNEKFTHVNWDTKYEPFGCHGVDHGGQGTKTALYTTPQQHTWIGLTEEDWDYLNKYCGSTRSAIKTAETLLKEKNCG